jgi:hypothetical protein
MDGTTFDQLIKRMATTRVSRLTALRGLAVGALAAAIGVASPDDAAAGSKKKNCGQCKKSQCHPKSTGGKKRCRCKKKANGTSCSIAGMPSAVCSDGSCVASATPLPPGPPPPGFNCTNAGCVGERAGLICDTGTGQCVNCTSYTQCGTVPGAGARACLAGRCRGGETCTTNAQCVNPPLFCLNPVVDLTRLICQFDNECDADTGTNGCTSTPATPICVLGYCTNACGTGTDCGPGKACQGGVCLFT